MISVVICSINKTFAQQVQKSIAETIGVVWEAIVIENTVSPQSLTRVYNSGASKAQYDIICFVHEDILFQTPQWGLKLIVYFNSDKSLGLIGLAGSKYKSKTPSGWFTGIAELDCCNIVHLDKEGREQKIWFNPVPGSSQQEAVVLDGVFLCCPKKVWAEVQFDEVLLKDFHLYDLDFSFRVAEKYKVIVSFEIDIVHITKGAHYGNKWLEATLLWHSKMQQRLPGYLPGFNERSLQYETSILRTWVIRLKHENLTLSNKLNWLYNIQIWAHVSAWPYTFLFFFKTLFRKK